MTTYRFVIPGRPKAKGRPRFARGRAYTDKKTLCPLTADLDNLCKTVKDGLNGVAYADDRYVQKLAARKK